MTRLDRALIAAGGLLAGVVLGNALADYIEAQQLTFSQRWGPAESLRPAIHPYNDYRAPKSDRGACVDRRPKCKTA